MTNHRLLHILWTKAVGTKNYDKQEWRELENRITKLTNYESKENKETFLSSRKNQVEQKNIQDKNNSE